METSIPQQLIDFLVDYKGFQTIWTTYQEDIIKLDYFQICPDQVEFETRVEFENRVEKESVGSCDLAANQDKILDRVYLVKRLGHMTKIDFQRQRTTELNYEPRTTMEEHTIEINCIGSAIKTEQQDD